MFLFVAALGIALAWALPSKGFPRQSTIFLSNLVVGGIAGWLFYRFSRNEKTKRELIRRRVQAVAELNHHIRNALQVIRYAGASPTAQDAGQLQLINEAVARIEWVLSEVLSGHPHDGPRRTSGAAVEASPAFSQRVVDDFILGRR